MKWKTRTQQELKSGYAIIVIGASMGGVKALTQLAGSLPPDLQAAVFVVLHTSPAHISSLSQILSRSGPLPAADGVHNQPILPGRIYTAPPDHHMLVRRGHLHMVRGPMENGLRPAVDPLFRSAAGAYGHRVIGVVLTGALDDGTAGLVAIKEQGGVAVIQDPADSFCPDMPENARTFVNIDYCVPLAAMGPLLGRLAHERA